MIPREGEDGWSPNPEMLAAYADGELDGDGRTAALLKRVEAWLAEHPEAVGEVQAQRRMTAWCQATAPPDPGEPAWAALAAQLNALPLPPPGKARRWSRLAWLAALGATAAAGLWLALTLLSPLERQDVVQHNPRTPAGQTQPSTLPRTPEIEAFPVATAAEVEILSVQGDDTGTLVIGELPVQGLLVLLGPGEVTLTSVEPAQDNMVPEIRAGGTIPMIWAPLDAEREDPEEATQG